MGHPSICAIVYRDIIISVVRYFLDESVVRKRDACELHFDGKNAIRTVCVGQVSEDRYALNAMRSMQS